MSIEKNTMKITENNCIEYAVVILKTHCLK